MDPRYCIAECTVCWYTELAVDLHLQVYIHVQTFIGNQFVCRYLEFHADSRSYCFKACLPDRF